MSEKISVYIMVDKDNKIISINSSIFLNDTNGWIKVDEGNGDKYAYPESFYLDKLLYVDMIPQYKYINNKLVVRTSEEIEKDKVIPELKVNDIDLIKAQLKAETARNKFIEDCMAEMAMIIYK